MAAGGVLHYIAAMKTLAYFTAAIIGTLLAAALLAYPVYLGVHALNPDWAFHRIASRLWLVLVIAATWVLGRRLALSRADFGFGVPRPRFRREVGIGFLAGILSMLPVAAMLMLFGTRPLVWVGSARLLHLLLSGLLSGLAVSLVEETLFRGLLQGAVWREAGTGRARRGLAILGVAVFYAALHFLARVSIPAASVNPYSGLTLLASVGDDFLHFGRIADSFAALTAVGILLSLTRLYTGSIALAIGLHAGWVMVMRITVGTTARPMDAPYAFLASTSDGFTGWLVFAWTAAIIAALLAGWRPAWLGMTPGARSPRT